ncbi:hypothetical protein CCACVL1_03722 [Corchorus capsularis]|uniref:Uncharacterized protein n=1 Tax=Corchorus capsularis TaxID=210143 RepID=A0A1R3JXJ2_COCAP|nr:hypothetical protein CCACVL1_03722 [Corchorus capsularis]
MARAESSSGYHRASWLSQDSVGAV